MPENTRTEEIEIKLCVNDIQAICRRLRGLRARVIVPRTYELNTLYDTPGQSLRRSGRLIRIRVEQSAATRKKARSEDSLPAILTYKGPSSSGPRATKVLGKSKARSRFKIKTEIELSISRPEEMARILKALDLHPSFRYEKFRTTYALPALPGLKIELDETPIGTYLELEGSTTGIDRAARLLGYRRDDYSTATYGSLYLAACRARGQKPGHMLFPPTKKLR